MPTLTAAPQPPHALGSQNDAPDNSLCDPPPRSAALRAASPRLWRHRCTCGAPREAGAGRRGVHTDFEKGRKMTHSKIDFAKRHPDLRRGAARRGDDRWCMAIRSSAGKLAVQQPGCPGNSLRLATTSSSRRHGAIDAGPNRRDATYARALAEMRALAARACRRCPPHVAVAGRCVEHACRRRCAPARRAGRRVRAAQRRLMVTATDEFPSRFACFCVPRVVLERNGATRVARGVRGELRERCPLVCRSRGTQSSSLWQVSNRYLRSYNFCNGFYRFMLQHQSGAATPCPGALTARSGSTA